MFSSPVTLLPPDHAIPLRVLEKLPAGARILGAAMVTTMWGMPTKAYLVSWVESGERMFPPEARRAYFSQEEGIYLGEA